MAVFQKTKTDSGYPTISLAQLFVAVTGVALAVTVSQLPSWIYELEVFGPRSSVKPYLTFSEFYPFYLSEHSDMNNRLLHLFGTTLSLIVMVLNPMLIQAMLAACSGGYILCSVFSGVSHGLYEGLAMVLLFLGLSRLSNDHRAALVSCVPAVSVSCISLDISKSMEKPDALGLFPHVFC